MRQQRKLIAVGPIHRRVHRDRSRFPHRIAIAGRHHDIARSQGRDEICGAQSIDPCS